MSGADQYVLPVISMVMAMVILLMGAYGHLNYVQDVVM